MRRYETTFILSPDLEETELEKNIERYTEIITAGGGIIDKEDRWGTRRLTYQIKKKTQGYYVHLVHRSGIEVPAELERQFLLNEDCLRYLTVRADERPAPVEKKKEKAEAPETGSADAEKSEGDSPTPAAESKTTPDETTPTEPPATENPPPANEDSNGA